MRTTTDSIFVKSHVARDLMQSAGLFKTDKLVVWEYVSNSLQYVSPGTNPVAKVTLDSRRKRIVIADNGRGMDWPALKNFFVMHGENVDRQRGRPGRGRFGTGKSAAFGIADVLRITTTRGGKQSKVEICRDDITAMTSEDPVPVRILEREVKTKNANGTVVEIEGIHLKSLDQAGIIHYIERHLARWPKNSTVFVNNHECEFVEPPIAQESRFLPDGPLRQQLGDVELVIKISKAPLDEDLRGISVFSSGVWHETTLAGSEGREMSQFIFGEIDVAQLDEDKSPIPPFDVSRSMRLNPDNELVGAIHSFIGMKVEAVRRTLFDAEKKRRQQEETKKLAEQAAEIARVLNEDFEAFRQRVIKARAKTVGGSDNYKVERSGGGDDDDLIFGHEVPAEIVAPNGGPGGDEGPAKPGPGVRRNNAPIVTDASPDEEKKGRRTGGQDGRPKSRGGFGVKFENMGSATHRAQYFSDERTIYINLDHPQLSAARGEGSIEEPLFRRLAYEVAFCEYSIALASELAARDEYIDPTDPIVDIRETLNRVARRGASLYS